MKRMLPRVLAPLLLPVLAAALGQWMQGGSGPSFDQLYPGPLGSAEFGAVLAGRFRGQPELDAIVLADGQPTLLVAPEVFDSAVGIGEDASSMAVLPGVVAGKDLLLVCGAGGLRSFERDSAQSEWIASTIFDGTSDWVDALELAVGDLDGEDGLDVAALSAAGDQILIAFGAGDGSFSEEDPIALSGPASYTLRLLDWFQSGDASGADELAVVSSQGTAVFETDGTLLTALVGGQAGMRTAVVDDTPGGLQRLAQVATANGVDFLRFYGSAGASSWSSLGAAAVVSLHAADADGDGDSDLLASVSSERKVRLYESQYPATPTVVPANVVKFTVGPSNRDPAWNHAGLAAADFDGDGTIDVLVPAQGGDIPLGGGAYTTVYSDVRMVHVDASALDDWRVSISDALFNVSTGVLLLDVHEPVHVLASSGSAVTQLELTVYLTPAFGEPTQAAPYHHSFHDLPDPEALVPVELPEGYSISTSPEVFSCVLRQVSVEGGQVLASGPAVCALVVSEANAGTLSGTGDTSVFAAIGIDPDSIPPQGGIGIGPTVPPTDPDDEPQPGR